MRRLLRLPASGRQEYFVVASRLIRWVVLALVILIMPYDSPATPILLTVITFAALINGLRYSDYLRKNGLFTSKANALILDHAFVLVVTALTGGLASPFYPLFYILLVAAIASYGIAGFAFALGAQIASSVALLYVDQTPIATSSGSGFVIQIVLLLIFALIAAQSVAGDGDDSLIGIRQNRPYEAERQRLLSLINSLSHAVLAIDADGKVYLYNAAALDLLETNRDITGQTIQQLLPLRDARGRHADILHLAKNHHQSINRQDLTYESADGETIILDLTLTPVHTFGFDPHGAGGGYMAVFRDITKEKSLEQERDEFISVTSHELRTPLAIAEANLSTALLPGYAKIEHKAETLIAQAHENIVFLSQLIEDLATLSRAERGDLKLKVEIIDARELAEELARDYRPQAEAKNLELVLEAAENTGKIVTSRPEFREILQNFLTNAIKYTTTGTVTLSVKPTEGGTEFAVKDTGIGISVSDKAKVFQKFYRSEDYRTRATGGTGLGLYITHKLAEKLGIKISFESKLNHGSTFVVFVPATEPPGEVAEHNPSVV
jgi:PAS domain S-box-containing protein